VCRTSHRALLVLVAHVSRVDHMGLVASACDDKLLLLISLMLNNVNSSGHIF
jgi:hypothetical protein